MLDSATTAPPALHSIDIAGQRLGVGRSTVFELIKTGQLRSVKVGHRRLVSEAAICEFIGRLDDASVA